MKMRLKFHTIAAVCAAGLAFTGCGGGGGSTASVVSPQITGTAATGAALANAAVSITNSANNSPCTESTITTTALGSYTCTLKSGETAPFFIVVTDPTGNSPALVSIATSTPVAGTPLLVNATPLTTAIVAQLNGGDALGVVTNKKLYISETFEAAKANVIAQIQSVVSAIDPALSHYDPFTTSITAATAGSSGNTADQVLDVIKITKTSSGALALSTISDPTPIAVATASTAGATVTAPTTSVSDLAQAAQLAAKAFSACYGLPVSQRVTLDSSQSITAVAPECQNIVTSADTPAGAPAFKSNGYSATQAFYGLLTSNLMTGAKFSIPEIMAFYPLDDSGNNPRDKAVINIRYLDNLGNPGNYITVVQNFPESKTVTRPSNWWITGNQWSYDISVKTNMRRVQEFNTKYSSRYQNGVNFNIYGGTGAPNSGNFDSVLVTGQGLPTVGLWYVRSAVTGLLNVTTMRNSTPQLSASLTPICECSTFWMSKSQGLAGTKASSLAANTTTAPYTYQWAGTADGSYNGVDDTKRPIKGSVYVFKIYKNGVLVATEKRTLLTDLVAATQAVNMQWNDIGDKTKSALDINNTAFNGTQTALPVDWIQNLAAEQVKNVWVSQTDGNYDNATAIKLGATSVIATPYSSGAATTFTSMTATYSDSVAPYGGYREIEFNYRMLDGSTKGAVYTYYP